ncbi:MAG TPA: BTAD domain-containing putative transcriptional regulator [Trebonia sp.]|jgi:DNA-binding SARP family transcriptional activator|nr:BTAD domain-containing putative transcriptional regulator [Trebonia sp.]
MEFRILGPLEVAAGGGRLELGGTRQQVVLAMLLLSPGRLVTVARLLEAIYGADPPTTAKSQAQISISRLRRLLADHGADGVISTQGTGYVLRVGPGQLDAQRFTELVVTARAARDAGNRDRAVASYREALRLWRGPALDGIDSQLVQTAASGLDEQRIAVNSERLELELDLGRHHELVGELAELADQFPLREQIREHLMLALYRCGRAADALQEYRRARVIMIEELGIEPGGRLRRLQHAILTADPALDPPAGPALGPSALDPPAGSAIDLPAGPAVDPPGRPALVAGTRPAREHVPSLLPTDIADFTDRVEQVGQIRRHLLPGGRKAGRAVPVVVIVGQGGVGKTSIAVHASHAVAGHFPGGQLFADLHGGSGRPVGPMRVLERFLRALGVPGPYIPEDLDERAEVYRNLLAGRKVLVVLDDAVSESQVSPLLPGTGAAAVLVTSRRRLAGLAGASHVAVDVLDPGKSVDLLGRIAGDDRIREQSLAASEVAAQCGHLPLALRIAGARLSARPHWSVQQLVERLADETRRLDELRHGELGIRPSISLSYDGVSEQARRLFRLLAVIELPYFSGWMAAALLDVPPAQVEDLVDELLNARLLETTGTGSGVHSQYRFHDLIRVFARERLATEEPAADREAAVERTLGGLLYLVTEAHRRHYGGSAFELATDALPWPLPEPLVDELLSDPLSWYERERVVLVAAVRQAAHAGLVELCWSLAVTAVALFESRVYLDDWQQTHDIALAAVIQAQHVRGQAAVLHSIGSLRIVQRRLDQVRPLSAEAIRLFTQVGDDQGVGLAVRNIAMVDRLTGQLDAATRNGEHALAMFRRTGDQVAEAYALQNLARVRLELGETGRARELLAEALRLTRAVHCGRAEAQVLNRIGEAELQAGDLAEALGAFELALTMTRELGDLVGEAYVLAGIGAARLSQGEFGPARDALQRALDSATAIGERLAGARALLGLAELALASGDPGQAAASGEQAAAAFADMRASLDQARALDLLGRAHRSLGYAAVAGAASAQAAALRQDMRAFDRYRPPQADG